MAKRKIEFPKRGEIYLANFDPTVSSEIQKPRPAIILQNDISNVVLLNQIRSLDKQCLVKEMGVISDRLMGFVDNAIQISLGLIEL